ncbi:MAG TPA: hypothetical protein VGM47_02200, partial [Gammaproteobacteria bacterium]
MPSIWSISRHGMVAAMFGIGSLIPCCPAWGDGVTPLPADGRLVYVRQSDQGCLLKSWDSKDGSTHDLVRLPECPKAIDVTSAGQALVLLDEADVRIFSLRSATLGDPIVLPGMATPPKAGGVGPALAGYTADGTLAVDMVADNRDDSEESFLFLREATGWAQAEHVHCDRMVPDCSFRQKFDAHPLGGVGATAGSMEIWNDALRGDPYVIKRVPETSHTRTAQFDGQNTLIFRV